MKPNEPQWELLPIEDAVRGNSAAPMLVTLAWPVAMASDPWLGLLLPTRDYNRELLGALRRYSLPNQAYVGVFLSHPYLNLGSVLAAVDAAGARGIAAFPGISHLTSSFAETAEQSGLALATESQRLMQAADHGFSTLATIGAPGVGKPLSGLKPDWVLTVPPVVGSELPAGCKGVLEYRPGAGSERRLPLPMRRTPD
ncbi:hypothetical protein HC341_01440 [Aquisalimonas sp. 2447]|uniref:hypothetical protein n=1 Tax=Aquisalimonas sp. 2447 TaxID=2740807 RepID=UPI00143254DC|nr:hypothetical protein [Aquisalimonas sp. 2447]QIT53994.1 hypothetical protein HC341_01440 [Aquisalimonas sp. 2447]